jgi:hypothetical protein
MCLVDVGGVVWNESLVGAVRLGGCVLVWAEWTGVWIRGGGGGGFCGGVFRAWGRVLGGGSDCCPLRMIWVCRQYR